MHTPAHREKPERQGSYFFALTNPTPDNPSPGSVTLYVNAAGSWCAWGGGVNLYDLHRQQALAVAIAKPHAARLPAANKVHNATPRNTQMTNHNTHRTTLTNTERAGAV